MYSEMVSEMNVTWYYLLLQAIHPNKFSQEVYIRLCTK